MTKQLGGAFATIVACGAIAGGIWLLADPPSSWATPKQRFELTCFLDGSPVVARQYEAGAIYARFSQGWLNLTDKERGAVVMMKVDVCVNLELKKESL